MHAPTSRVRFVAIGAALIGLLAACAPPRLPDDWAVRFDGDDDHLEIGPLPAGHPLLLARSRFTIAARFRQEPGGDPFARIVDRSSGPYGEGGYALAVDPESGAVHLYVHDGTTGADFVSSRGACPPGLWHTVVGVAREGALEIWVDGRRDGRSWYEAGAPALPSDRPSGMRIGSWNHADAREWKGEISEVAVWSTDLGEREIVALFGPGSLLDLGRDLGPYEGASRLVGWWRMGDGPEGGSGRRVVDVSSGGAAASFAPDSGPAFVTAGR